MNILWIIIASIVLVMNLAAYIVMAVDKKRAIKGAWRIPEKTLFLITGLFGGVGGTLGVFRLRHKSKHWYFRVFFPVMTVLQAALLIWLWSITH